MSADASNLADWLVSHLRVLRCSADQFLRGTSISNPTDLARLSALTRLFTGRRYRPGSDEQYLTLQEAMQNESRAHAAVSNIMKTKHDTVKNSISNVR